MQSTRMAIRVRWHKQETVVPRDDVCRVRFANIRRRNTLLGMAVGAGTGAIVGVAASGDAAGAGLALLGTGVGAATAGAQPIGRPLYQAQVRRKAGNRSPPLPLAGRGPDLVRNKRVSRLTPAL